MLHPSMMYMFIQVTPDKAPSSIHGGTSTPHRLDWSLPCYHLLLRCEVTVLTCDYLLGT